MRLALLSQSYRGMPRRAHTLHTTLLPAPIPPVTPITIGLFGWHMAYYGEFHTVGCQSGTGHTLRHTAYFYGHALGGG